jgi:hypothetical protein
VAPVGTTLGARARSPQLSGMLLMANIFPRMALFACALAVTGWPVASIAQLRNRHGNEELAKCYLFTSDLLVQHCMDAYEADLRHDLEQKKKCLELIQSGKSTNCYMQF